MSSTPLGHRRRARRKTRWNAGGRGHRPKARGTT
jgi:hypothetical protein